MKNKKIAIAMSGGVDSSVAAYVLKEKGYNIFGITMKVVPKYACNSQLRNEIIIRDAKKVAKILDIPHYTLDLREEFEEEVIEYFVDEYSKGRTPNPCIACNGKIKFGSLFDEAIKLGADYIVTGHYAEIESNRDTGEYFLKKSKDLKKDQSYFLYNIRKENLKKILMPLKDYTKDQVREMAKKINLEISKKPDSEEICFIPDDNYGAFIEENFKNKNEQGNFIDRKGNILGKHKGIINYTKGQRRGLGISLGERAYVIDILEDSKDVVLGREEELYSSKLYADEINLLTMEKLPKTLRARAKVRSTSTEKEVIVKAKEDGMIVEFIEAERAITKGQSIVLYDGDIVIGGGIVKEVY